MSTAMILLGLWLGTMLLIVNEAFRFSRENKPDLKILK